MLFLTNFFRFIIISVIINDLIDTIPGEKWKNYQTIQILKKSNKIKF